MERFYNQSFYNQGARKPSYANEESFKPVTRTRYILPYAGVDLRRLPWDKVIEIMEKQAEVYKLYQTNFAYGWLSQNQQTIEYIESFNEQFKFAMERVTDVKQLPVFLIKCIPLRDSPAGFRKRPVPALVPKKMGEPEPVKKRKFGISLPERQPLPEPVQHKTATSSAINPPIYRYTPPKTSSSTSATQATQSTVEPTTMPIVAKFRIERHRDNNNCEFFDLTADPDFDDKLVHQIQRTPKSHHWDEKCL